MFFPWVLTVVCRLVRSPAWASLAVSRVSTRPVSALMLDVCPDVTDSSVSARPSRAVMACVLSDISPCMVVMLDVCPATVLSSVSTSFCRVLICVVWVPVVDCRAVMAFPCWAVRVSRPSRRSACSAAVVCRLPVVLWREAMSSPWPDTSSRRMVMFCSAVETRPCRFVMLSPCCPVSSWSSLTAVSSVVTRPDTPDNVLLRSLICWAWLAICPALAVTSASMSVQRCCSAVMAFALTSTAPRMVASSCRIWSTVAENAAIFSV